MLANHEPLLTPLCLTRFPLATLDPRVTRLACTTDPTDGRPPERWVVEATGAAGLPRAHDLCVLDALVTLWSAYEDNRPASFGFPAAELADMLAAMTGLPFSETALRRALRRLSEVRLVEAELDVPALATTPGEPTREVVGGEGLLTWSPADADADPGEVYLSWGPQFAHTEQVRFGPWFHATLCRGDLRPLHAAPLLGLLSPFGQVLCRHLDHQRALGRDWRVAWPELRARLGLAPGRWPAPTEALWKTLRLLSEAGLVRHHPEDETGAFAGVRFPADSRVELRNELSPWLKPEAAKALLSQHGPEAAAELLDTWEAILGMSDEARCAQRFAQARDDGVIAAARLHAWCGARWPLNRRLTAALRAAA